MEKKEIAGLRIDNLTKAELLEQLRGRIQSGQKTFLSTPYSEFLYRSLCDNSLLNVLNQADFAVPDGIGLFWALRYLSVPLSAKNYWLKILQAYFQAKWTLAAIIFFPKWIRSAFAEKIPGSDLIWDLAKLGNDNNWSVYLLGGFGGTPKLVAEQLKIKNLNLKISGMSAKNPDDPTVIQDINSASPDLLFVAYGPIKQEKWIAEHFNELPIKLAVGLGGAFDYIAGKASTPPRWVRAIGLEWLYRLFTQPKRIKRIWQATFGLASALVHYKVFNSLPLRPNVAAVILNQKKQVLVCQRDPKNFHVDIITNRQTLKSSNYWQLPQGGTEPGENLVEAAVREAREETGIGHLEHLHTSQKTHTYVWNNAVRKFWKNRRHKNIGQQQNIIYFKFAGQYDEIKIDHDEFINFKWVEIPELEKTVHQERLPLINIVLEDLKEMCEKGIINLP